MPYSLYIRFAQHFYHEAILNFIECLSCSNWDVNMVLSFIMLMSDLLIYIYWAILTPLGWIALDQGEWFFYVLLDSILWYFVEEPYICY